MGKFKKLLEKWIENPPREARIKDVQYLAERCGITWRNPKKGSHAIIQDPRLIRFNENGQYKDILKDEMCIPSINGKLVKGIYIKRLVEFIQFIGVENIVEEDDEPEES